METIQDKIDQLKRFGYEVINEETTIEVRLKTKKGFGCCCEVSHEDFLTDDNMVTSIVYNMNYLIKKDL